MLVLFSDAYTRQQASMCVVKQCECLSRYPGYSPNISHGNAWIYLEIHVNNATSIIILSNNPPWWRHQMEMFPCYWPFVRGIHRSPVNSPHKGQWRGALMFTLIYARINGWVNKREAGDLGRNRAHCDVIVMLHSSFMYNEVDVGVICSTLYSYRTTSFYCGMWQFLVAWYDNDNDNDNEKIFIAK